MRKYIQITFQFVTIMLIRFGLRIFHRTRMQMPSEQLQGKYPTVIVANHRKAIDPWIITSFLPFKVICTLLPFSFMTHNYFYDSPIKPFMWLWGCFPAKKNEKYPDRLYGVASANHKIASGYSLVIFPQGTRVKEGEISDAKPGVTRITEAIAGPYNLILVHLTYSGAVSHIAYRHKIVNAPADASEIMEEIFQLPFQGRGQFDVWNK